MANVYPPLDWSAVDLVVFDVDGTLYDQRRLRLSMLLRLLQASARSGRTDVLRTIHTFRRVREELGDQQCADFVNLQYSLTANRCGKSIDEVRALTHEWMERRPLPLLGALRYPHLDRLFEGLRRAGKIVAVFSDYAAADKLKALGLSADPIVCAGDSEVGRLKPDPAGLHAILASTGVEPSRALMIGDRVDRDAAAAERACVHALIRSHKTHISISTFVAYDDPVFHAVLAPR